VSTNDTEGLRVLWNGRRRGEVERHGAWLASSRDELVALWREAGIVAPLPQVDFARYRVSAPSHRPRFRGSMDARPTPRGRRPRFR
jgi:hypothetical protein